MGTVGTEDQRTRGTEGTEDKRHRGPVKQWVQRIIGTVSTEDRWNSDYRGPED